MEVVRYSRPSPVKLSAHRLMPFSARTRDHARLALLILVALEVFVLPSMLAAGMLSPIHLGVVSALTLVAGVVAVSEGMPMAVVAGSISAVALVGRIVVLGHPTKQTRVVNASLTILVTGLFVGLVLAYVFGKERSTIHRMVGAVAAYLLIAVAWGKAYEILWLTRPSSLNLAGGSGDYDDLLYFSFATLTTLGYGTPIGPFARALVSMEALVGQLYPAILIARLVSLPSSVKHDPS
jgi:hypothetical protein